MADLNFNLFSSFNEMQLIRIWFLFSGIFAMDSVTQKSVRFEEYLRNFKFHSNVESARQTALLNKWGSWGILFILENYFSSLRNRLIRALGGHSHWELIKIHGNGRIEGFDLEYFCIKMLNFVFSRYNHDFTRHIAIRTCNTIHRQSSMVDLSRITGNQWFVKNWSYKLSKKPSVLREILRGRGG